MKHEDIAGLLFQINDGNQKRKGYGDLTDEVIDEESHGSTGASSRLGTLDTRGPSIDLWMIFDQVIFWILTIDSGPISGNTKVSLHGFVAISG